MVIKFPLVFPGRQAEKRMFRYRKPTAYRTLSCATALAYDVFRELLYLNYERVVGSIIETNTSIEAVRHYHFVLLLLLLCGSNRAVFCLTSSSC